MDITNVSLSLGGGGGGGGGACCPGCKGVYITEEYRGRLYYNTQQFSNSNSINNVPKVC